MAEPRPFHLVLLGQLQQLTVTRVDSQAADGIAIDLDLLTAAGFIAFEKVELASSSSGVRLSLQVLPAEAGSGEVGIQGAASQLVHPGEVLTISSWGWMREKPARKWSPRVHAALSGNRLPVVESVPSEPVKKKTKRPVAE